MKRIFALIIISFSITALQAQKKTVAQIKTELEKAVNPVGYARDVLKKRYKIDTIIIRNATYFMGIVDSLAYHGKAGKVYGPYDKKYMVQILGKAPNSFSRISQVFIDTSTFTRRVADSLANSIMARIKNGEVSFEDMAQTYSMGGEGRTKGDLGWMARGAMIPSIEKEVNKRKKGDVFKVWTKTGVHIIKITGDTKQDDGFVLLMWLFL